MISGSAKTPRPSMLEGIFPEGRGSLRGAVQREGVGEGKGGLEGTREKGNGGLEGTREKGKGGLEGAREGARGGAVFLVFVGELCILAGSKNNELKEIT